MQDVFTTDIIVQRLEANIHNLQGQLIWVKAAMQAQLATIQAQATTIQAKEARLQYLELSQLLTSGQVIIDSQVQPETSPGDDREPIVKGILEVKRFDLWGAGELNLPEMVRRIKAFVARRKGGDNDAA